MTPNHHRILEHMVLVIIFLCPLILIPIKIKLATLSLPSHLASAECHFVLAHDFLLVAILHSRIDFIIPPWRQQQDVTL